MPTRRQHLRGAIENGLLRPGPDATYADGDDSRWTAIDWPAMTRKVPVLGREVNVVDTGTQTTSSSGTSGSGPPLLFVHGLGGCWQNWLLNIPEFMGAHRVIAPDLPGFGESQMPAQEITIKGYGKVLDGLCEALEVENPVVVGNSMGGFVGTELALAFPTRVEKLVLVSAAGLSLENARQEPLLTGARVWAAGATWLGVRGRSVVTRPRMRRIGMQLLVRYPEKLSPALTYELARGTGTPGFVPAMKALLSYSVREKLSSIEVPVLIVWGRNDMLVPRGDARKFVELIGPNARREMFDDTGHLAMLERPSRFNALLAAFIAGERAPESEVEGVSA